MTTPPPDPICVCGYRQSQHGEVSAACKRFDRSSFLNLDVDDRQLQSYLESKPMRVKRR